MDINNNLITSAKNGNMQDFEKLINICLKKSRIVIKFQYKISDFDLDDITQLVTLKVWRKISEFRAESSFYTWFFTIFKNETLNFLKKNQAINKYEQPLFINETNDSQELDYVSNIALDDKLQETAASILEKRDEAVESQKMVMSILSKLSKKHYDVLNMIIFEEKSYDDVSKKLDIPIGTVMSRFFHAKKHAKKLINEYTRINDIQLPSLGR